MCGVRLDEERGFKQITPFLTRMLKAKDGLKRKPFENIDDDLWGKGGHVGPRGGEERFERHFENVGDDFMGRGPTMGSFCYY